MASPALSPTSELLGDTAPDNPDIPFIHVTAPTWLATALLQAGLRITIFWLPTTPKPPPPIWSLA